MTVLLVQILVLLVLCALSAFFSGSETILFSITPAQRQRIRARDAAADERIGRCLSDSARLLSTLIVGNTLVNFAIASLGYHVFVAALPDVGGFVAVPAMTLLLLLFGEITPKQIALRRAERLAPVCARLMLFWGTVLAPFNVVLRAVSKAFAKSLSRERRALSDGELVSVLEFATERGEFAPADVEMICRRMRAPPRWGAPRTATCRSSAARRTPWRASTTARRGASRTRCSCRRPSRSTTC